MNKKDKLLLFFALFLAPLAHAQNEANHWYFGNGAGVDFSSGSPVVVTDSQMDDQYGAVASVSHPISGDLLFYSNGIKVWNSNHDTMPNGFGLAGDAFSTTLFALPFVNNADKYYLFTTTEGGGDIRYSVIDMSLDNGWGDIESGTKNTLLHANCTEKITATMTQDSTAFWLLIHESANANFVAYKVDVSGIGAPVQSAVGTASASSSGYMKFNHAGNQLGFVHANNLGVAPFELFNFDKQTGIVSFPQFIFEAQDMYSLEFSPDDSKLYISFRFGNTLQFDLAAGRLLDIQNSVHYLNYNGGNIQLAPNGRIYVTNSGLAYLDEIQFPNLAGAACNQVQFGVNLQGAASQFGLPSFVQSIFYTPVSINATNAPEFEFTVAPNPASTSIRITTALDLDEIRIVNSLGQVVQVVNAPDRRTSIAVAELPNGIYFIEAISKSARVTKQFVKI